MSGRIVITVLSLIVSFSNFVNGSRILAVCPTPSISHQKVVRGLALALHKQGHELVVVTTDPLNDPNLKNYTEIDIGALYNEPYMADVIKTRGRPRPVEPHREAIPAFNFLADQILDYPELRKLFAWNNNEKFDLILLEMFFWPSFLALGPRFDAPIVGVASMGLLVHIQYEIGNPMLHSHPSVWEASMHGFGSFIPWPRLRSFIKLWRHIYSFESEFIPKQEALAKKYFGNDIPSLRELQRNVSLIFVNQQLPISFARPNLPHIMEINSFDDSKQVEPLPEGLQRFLDEATQGFVYMSLGSTVRSSMMSDELRNEFVAAFAELPYKVIWKFEDEDIPGKPDNLITMKWTPQEAILAHPNIKVFVYQGGLQSTEEAISHAVPLIGCPVMGDQDMNVKKMVSLGVARKLEITTINKNDLANAINAVATDVSYKQKMLELQFLLKDKPYDLLKNAVWWTEHVIRHRGAPYLRSTFADEPWYQRQDMDIIAFLSIGSFIIFSSIATIIYKLVTKFKQIFTPQSSSRKIKLN